MAGISETRWMLRWAEAWRSSTSGSVVQAREVTPSRHDFHQAISTGRDSIALIAQYARRSPEEPLPTGVELGPWLEACDEGEVAALALATDERFGTSEVDLRAARGTDMPLLHHQPCLTRDDVVRSRLLGADAVWTHAAFAPATGEILQTAQSFHMAALVEVSDEAQLTAALAAGARALCFCGYDDAGAQDLDPALELVARAPAQTTRVIRGAIANPVAFEPLRGKVDAVWLCGPALVALAEGTGVAALVAVAEGR